MKKVTTPLKYSPINNQFPDNRLLSIVSYTKNTLKTIYSPDELHVIIRTLKEEILNQSALSKPENIRLQTSELIRWYKCVERLKNHEPLAYIVGKAWFFKYPFIVNPNVLIPRPETEELVEIILKSCSKDSTIRILDIGTGSGCIAITLKKELPFASVSAMDVSEEALSVAMQNAQHLGAHVHFIHADLMEWTSDGKWDMIVSNPPYIPKEEAHLIPENVKNFEPAIALFTQKNPLEFYDRIFRLSGTLLSDTGKLFLECHQHFSEEVLKLSQNYSYLKNNKIICDASGNLRFFVSEKRN
jgi:release factor glutamine methyltransferase